jgi:hypothetical protein
MIATSECAVTLQLGELILQLSPFVPTDDDRRRTIDVATITTMTGRVGESPIEKTVTDFLVIADLALDLLLKSAGPNDPTLTRDRLEENLDNRNLPLVIAALTRMSEIKLTRMLETLECRSEIN